MKRVRLKQPAGSRVLRVRTAYPPLRRGGKVKVLSKGIILGLEVYLVEADGLKLVVPRWVFKVER